MASLYSGVKTRLTGDFFLSLPSGAVPSSICQVLACSDLTSGGCFRVVVMDKPSIALLLRTRIGGVSLIVDREGPRTDRSASAWCGRLPFARRRLAPALRLRPTAFRKDFSDAPLAYLVTGRAHGSHPGAGRVQQLPVQFVHHDHRRVHG